MKKRFAAIGIALLMQAGISYGADDTYFGMKAGMFMPNGKSPGLDMFDTGYAIDLSLGVKPASYAAVEVGTGFYTASGDSDATGVQQDMTAYAVPITLTAKGIVEFGKLDLFAGAGAGMFFCFIDNEIAAPVSKNESKHGIAPGYQAVAGADYRINNQWNAGVDFKWFSTRPKLEITDTNNNITDQKWEFGGTVLSLGVKYKF